MGKGKGQPGNSKFFVNRSSSKMNKQSRGSRAQNKQLRNQQRR